MSKEEHRKCDNCKSLIGNFEHTDHHRFQVAYKGAYLEADLCTKCMARNLSELLSKLGPTVRYRCSRAGSIGWRKVEND